MEPLNNFLVYTLYSAIHVHVYVRIQLTRTPHASTSSVPPEEPNTCPMAAVSFKPQLNFQRLIFSLMAKGEQSFKYMLLECREFPVILFLPELVFWRVFPGTIPKNFSTVVYTFMTCDADL